MSGLCVDFVERYRRDGYLSPLSAFSQQDAVWYRLKLEEFEAEIGGKITSNQVDEKYRYRLHTLLPWAYELATLPSVLDVLESVIGPDILIYMTTFFIKEARAEVIVKVLRFVLRPSTVKWSKYYIIGSEPCGL